MIRPVAGLVVGALGGLALSGCASMPNMSPQGTAAKAGRAASITASQTRDGVGDAVQAPLEDFNLKHAVIPPVLIRAYARPYGIKGLDTCAGILGEVQALDLALGPDIDIPRASGRDEDMVEKGAGFAADAALDAVRSATTGVIPVRSWVRRLSGANRVQQQARAAALAGSVRRGFVKALGMEKGCGWPAAPLSTVERQGAAADEGGAMPPKP